jgi:hypothetical protein
MELFLNFLWVLIAVSGLSVWRFCWAPGRPARRGSLQEWTAIVAALVLLFFAVSLSDDLHSGPILFEESANGRRQSVTLATAHSSPGGLKQTPAPAGVVPSPVPALHSLNCIGLAYHFQTTAAPLRERHLRLVRGPPSVSF